MVHTLMYTHSQSLHFLSLTLTRTRTGETRVCANALETCERMKLNGFFLGDVYKCDWNR